MAVPEFVTVRYQDGNEYPALVVKRNKAWRAEFKDAQGNTPETPETYDVVVYTSNGQISLRGLQVEHDGFEREDERLKDKENKGRIMRSSYVVKERTSATKTSEKG